MVNSSNTIYTNFNSPRLSEVIINHTSKIEEFLSSKNNKLTNNDSYLKEKTNIQEDKNFNIYNFSQEYTNSAQKILNIAENLKENKNEKLTKSLENEFDKLKEVTLKNENIINFPEQSFKEVNLNKNNEITEEDIKKIKEDMSENIDNVYQLVKNTRNKTEPVIEDKTTANAIKEKTLNLIKGEPEKAKEIQSKALDANTILALLKAR